MEVDGSAFLVSHFDLIQKDEKDQTRKYSYCRNVLIFFLFVWDSFSKEKKERKKFVNTSNSKKKAVNSIITSIHVSQFWSVI